MSIEQLVERLDDIEETVQCENCGTETARSQIELASCPECGEQVIHDPSPSRGSMSVVLANDAIANKREEQRDVFRTLLHYLGCGVLNPSDIREFYYYSINEKTQAAFRYGVEYAKYESEDADDKVMVCPKCGDTVHAWAHWFDPCDERGEFFASEEVEGDA